MAELKECICGAARSSRDNLSLCLCLQVLDERSIYVREDREDGGASKGRSPKVNGETNGSFRERGSRATNGTAAADNAKARLGL